MKEELEMMPSTFLEEVRQRNRIDRLRRACRHGLQNKQLKIAKQKPKKKYHLICMNKEMKFVSVFFFTFSGHIIKSLGIVALPERILFIESK